MWKEGLYVLWYFVKSGSSNICEGQAQTKSFILFNLWTSKRRDQPQKKISTKKVLSPRKQKNGINYNYCKIFITKDIPTNDKQATIYYLYLKTSSMIVQI